jgi:hypothetical protein
MRILTLRVLAVMVATCLAFGQKSAREDEITN